MASPKLPLCLVFPNFWHSSTCFVRRWKSWSRLFIYLTLNLEKITGFNVHLCIVWWLLHIFLISLLRNFPPPHPFPRMCIFVFKPLRNQLFDLWSAYLVEWIFWQLFQPQQSEFPLLVDLQILFGLAEDYIQFWWELLARLSEKPVLRLFIFSLPNKLFHFWVFQFRCPFSPSYFIAIECLHWVPYFFSSGTEFRQQTGLLFMIALFPFLPEILSTLQLPFGDRQANFGLRWYH